MKPIVWVALCLACFAVGWLLHPGRPPVVDPATQHELDSLRATRPTFDSLQRRASDSVTRFRDSTARLTVRVAALQRAAGLSGHRADSLAGLATVVDTAPNDSAAYFRLAYQERTSEADSLRIAGALGFTAMRDAQLVASTCLRAQIDAEGRMNQQTQVIEGLQAVIAKARAPSRLSLALFGGYGGALSGGKVVAAPMVGVGVSYALRLPRLF
ncbi:MAG TPA: hypothetical protein VK681_38995 [Reyranella sp.]|nr:hypothetical protein [Reyranella sp.]